MEYVLIQEMEQEPILIPQQLLMVLQVLKKNVKVGVYQLRDNLFQELVFL
jgi:hypothetical protein